MVSAWFGLTERQICESLEQIGKDGEIPEEGRGLGKTGSGTQRVKEAGPAQTTLS